MRFSADLIKLLIIRVLLAGRTQGAARFTVVPPSILYVSVGETAKLVWDYSVDNRNEEFDVFSPKWVFDDGNDSLLIIAQENIFKNWKWYINNGTCPARLLNPVRVSKESTATLVIHNVTLADSGTYGCVLILASGNPITSKVKLVVTSFPHIVLNPPYTHVAVNESQALFINCSADGTPAPTVTWRSQIDIRDKGVRKATVNITSITRQRSGIYECCATNNPTKAAVCKSTLVSVQYKPEIDVNSTFSIYKRSKIILRCIASGVPSPRFTLYDPSNRSITTGSHDVTGGSLVIIDEGSYGLYKCKAENILGYDEHFINVTHTVFPTSQLQSINPPRITKSTQQTITGQNSRTKPVNKSCSFLFFQDRSFAIAHLIITSITVTVNIFMAVLFCFKFKRTSLKTKEKKADDQRVLQQECFAMQTNGIEMEPQETAVSGTPGHEPRNPIPPAVDNEAVSRGPSPMLLDERKPKENHVEQHSLSGTPHLYQQLNNEASLSKEHVYQPLQRKTEVEGQPLKHPFEAERETSNLNQQQQEPEYQQLHIYSSVEQ